MQGWAIVDGRLGPLGSAVLPIVDPAVMLGWSVFETMAADAGEVPELSAHLDRLARSCVEGRIPMPSRGLLAEEVAGVARRQGGSARVRITLTGGGHRLVVATPRRRDRMHEPVRCVRGEHHHDPNLSGAVKHGSRMGWVLAVQRSGADDVLLVDAHGRFTEGTTCAVLAVVDGVLHTAPHDGRILESTSCTRLLATAAELGIPVERTGPAASGPWDALYVASATRGLAPVVELDGVALPEWEPVGRRLVQAMG